MPSTGMPRSSSSPRSAGAPSEYTDAGPPESTSAVGRRSRICSRSRSWGSSSAYTPQSRIRRAISWEYWPPKSSTSTSSCAVSGAGTSTVSSATGSLPGRARAAVSVAGTAASRSVIADGYPRGDRGAAVGAHADLLLALKLLALGLKRGGDHHLGALEVADVLVAAGRHRRPQGPHQVEGAVVLMRGAHQDLLHGPVLRRRHPGPPWQRGMEGRHPPVKAAARRFLGPRQRRADHHRVGTAGDRLRDVASGAHPAVGDHVAVLAGLEHVLGAGRGDVGDRGRLGHAETEHPARGTGGAGADPAEDADGAGAHQV